MTVSCCDHDCQPAEAGGRYRRILWVALGLNAAMFLVEIVASVIAGSVSLRADALDFLGDAANYAVALAVVGLALHWRARAALLKGSVMGMFGLWVAGSTIYSRCHRDCAEGRSDGGNRVVGAGRQSGRRRIAVPL